MFRRQRHLAPLAPMLAALAFLYCANDALAAATRYASPAGSGTACSAAAPCDLVTAVGGAGPGDQIVVAGDAGTYGTPGSPITTQLTDAGSVTIRGVAGEPMPVIYLDVAGTGLMLNHGGSASDLDVEDVHAGSAAVFVGSAIDHLIAHGAGSGCTPAPGATLIDILCYGSSNGLSAGLAASGTMTMRNVTAVATGSGDAIQLSANGNHEIVNATNVIAHGAPNDVTANATGAGSVTINLDHSNYAHISGSGTTITPAGAPTDQTAAPAFVNSAGGDFHQASTSPTIDAGADSAQNGTTDFEGKPRTFGPQTDIGADEYAPPSVLSESASSVTEHGAVLGASVNSEGAAAHARIDYGPTAAYGTSVALPAPAFTASPQSLSATTGVLSAATTYHYRIVVSNSSGTTAGSDATFTTAPPAPQATISSLRETNRTFRATLTPQLVHIAAQGAPVGTTFRFNLSRGAAVRFDFTQPAPGRKWKGKCVGENNRNKHHRRCTRALIRGSFTFAGHSGPNSVRFLGWLSMTHRLTPGSYTLIVTATAPGAVSTWKTLRFTIVS